MENKHNCYLCAYEWLGRCQNTWFGKDVTGNPYDICEGYKFAGTPERLKEIEGEIK